MKKNYFLKLLIAFFVIQSVVNIKANAQGHILGFGSMDGGVENQTVGASPNVSGTSLLTGTQQTAYTTAQAASSVGTVNSTGARTGNKCIQWATSSTSNLLWTPTAASTAIASTTSYVVQFYYTYASGSARAFVVGVGTDGTSGASTATTSSLAVTSTYTKVSVVVTSGSSSNTPRYGMVSFKPSGGSFSTPYVLDDIVVYAGSAEDVTAPNAPASAAAFNTSSTSLNVIFGAPTGGVDGGGYLVVRGTTDPTTAPNVNGIYAVGNSIGSGTVAYIGTNTSFVDAGLTPNTTYYYRVYAVDKAFNYSAAATASGYTGVAPIVFSNIKAYQKANAINIDWASSVEINMQEYVIEKSADGNNFSALTTIPAKGYASNYSVTDNNIFSKNNYYRIKAIEKNGAITYTNVLNVKIDKAYSGINISPNPVQDGIINLQLAGIDKGNYTIKVFDAAGKLLLQKNILHDGGAANFVLTTNSSNTKTAVVVLEGNTTKLSKQIYFK